MVGKWRKGKESYLEGSDQRAMEGRREGRRVGWMDGTFPTLPYLAH